MKRTVYQSGDMSFVKTIERLSLLKEQFATTPIAAFTATATNAVEQDIATNLGLQTPKRVRGSLFQRKSKY